MKKKHIIIIGKFIDTGIRLEGPVDFISILNLTDFMQNVLEAALRLLTSRELAKMLVLLEATIIRVYGIKKNTDTLPGGIQPHDLACIALLSVLNGERVWDPNKEPNLVNFLVHNVVRSILSHLRESNAATKVKRVNDLKLASYVAPELLEEQLITHDLIEKIEADLGDDTLTKTVFRYRLDGYTDIAIHELLGVSMYKVLAAKAKIVKAGTEILRKRNTD